MRVAWVALLAVAALVAWACEDDPPPGPPDVTLEAAIEAVSRPGQVFYAEYDLADRDEPAVQRAWYSPDLGAGRVETLVGGEVVDAQVIAGGGQVSYSFREGFLHERPSGPVPAGAPDAGIMVLSHLSPWLHSENPEVGGVTTRNAVQVVRVRSTHVAGPGEDSKQGTRTTWEMYLRRADLMPHSVVIKVRVPGEKAQPDYEMLCRKTEFVDPATLPADLFDPDALKAEQVTPDEALGIASRLPFAAFWFGPAIPVHWEHPAGIAADGQVVMSVHGPGLPGHQQAHLAIEYGTKEAATVLLIVAQGPVATFEAVRPERLAAMRAAGNVRDLPGGGFLYAEYFPGRCGYDEAQAKPECRFARKPSYGVVLEREGTRVHITAPPKFGGPDPNTASDTNPFNEERALAGLAGQLQRLAVP